MSIRLYAKSFVATAAAIEPHLFVKASNGAETVQLAAASTDPIIGSSGEMGCEAGELLDVIMAGEDEVTAGGNIALGDPLTSDANGKAIKATATASTAVRIAGFAAQAAVAGDVFRYAIAPGFLTKPSA